MLPLVSIVMPSLNQAGFVVVAVQSVLSQSYEHLELIVADGGSTDGTLALLHQQQGLDSRLRWMSAPDTGPADALNKALPSARGTIVGWLNSDDLYAEGAIDRAVQALVARRDWLMVYGQGQHIDGAGLVLGRYPTVAPPVPITQFANGCHICQPTVFFRRSMFVLLGPLDQGLKAAFDFDYWLRAFAAFPGRIGFVDALQAQSRLHPDCITLRMRRTATLEAMQVVARHLGHAPGVWLLAYVRELLAMPPSERKVGDLAAHVAEMLALATAWMRPADLLLLQREFDRLGVGEGMGACVLAADVRVLTPAVLPAMGPRAAPPVSALRFGVNLIGFAFGELGLGEDLRMAAQACDAAGVPFKVLNIDPGKHLRQADRLLASHCTDDVAELPYAINLFCLTAADTQRVYAERGAALFDGRHNIGWWPWELPVWPQRWRGAFTLVDEVWAATRFTQTMFGQATDRPVTLMPLPVSVARLQPVSRPSLGLPSGCFLFLFVFDFNSYLARKNPLAVIAAFQRAFPVGDGSVGLVLKTMNGRADNDAWQQFVAVCAADPRITLLDRTLDREVVLGLVDACDAYVSLHRAEGFGRTLAEAMLLGKPVVGTDFSGNTDFLTQDTGYPVK
jgi:hypothetical protein